jgi:tRNA 2-thiouridine synthesizing protein A
MPAALPLTQLDPTTWQLDCLGMLCPVPVIKTGQAFRRIPVGHELRVLADDPGVELDLKDWAAANRQELLAMEVERGEGRWTARLRRLR